MSWTARTFRTMANAAAEIEATNSASRLAGDPGALQLAEWARKHRTQLEAKVEALETGIAPDELTLSMFPEKE